MKHPQTGSTTNEQAENLLFNIAVRNHKNSQKAYRQMMKELNIFYA